MLQNYLKIAWRNLRLHKAFSFINIFGLALSMGVCLHVITVIKDAHSYDRFHPDSGRTYRILTEAQRTDGSKEPYASSPYPVAKSLTEDYSQVELWTPLLISMNGAAKANGKELADLRGMFTDGSFFKMFGFELASGDPATALNEPWSMVLTAELAEKLFQQEDPIGKEVEMPAFGTYKVTGVLKKFPGKTHLQFEALGSIATQVALEKTPDAWNITGDWRNYYGGYHYVRLKPGTDSKTVELALAEIAKTKFVGLELESRDKGYRFELQPLDGITPSRMLSQNMGQGPPTVVLWFLSALALVIILSASFNYTNLTIARSLLRTKEVGVRKVLGATRAQVFRQLIGEAVIMSFLALLVAYGLYKIGSPLLEQGSFTDSLASMRQEDVTLYGWFLLFALVVGIFAGALPAATLSKTTPLQILQKIQKIRLIQRVGLRKVLLGFQFTVTLVFFFMLTIMGRQVDFAIRQNFGFDRPQTLLVQMQQQDYGRLAAAFSQVQGVETMSAISFPMGTYFDRTDDVRSDSITEKTGVRDYFIDHNYLNHFRLPLLAGENFPENPTQQHELFTIVNEKFCQHFKMGTPAEAVGKALTIGDSSHVVVRGVLKDFNFKPANYHIEPLMLRYNPAELSVMNVQLAGNDIPTTLLGLERTWKQIAPKQEFLGEFFDKAVRRNYHDMQSTSRGVGFFGLLGMIIACMGLLGMAMYTVETKAKEIGIRKVMGAGVQDVALMLSKGYFVVLGISILVALPISYFLGNKLLEEFAQRIGWSPGLFLPGLLLLLVVAGVTVGSQTVRAAMANPAKSLHSE